MSPLEMCQYAMVHYYAMIGSRAFISLNTNDTEPHVTTSITELTVIVWSFGFS